MDKKMKSPRGGNLDIDSLYKKAKIKPPKINVEKALAKVKNKTIHGTEFSYAEAARILGLKNSNNIIKWFDSESLSFNTLKMIMYVLNCRIEDLIEQPKNKTKNHK